MANWYRNMKNKLDEAMIEEENGSEPYFRQLIQKVRELKNKEKTLNNERSDTSDRERYAAIPQELAVVTNQLYDAVGDLCEYIEQATGISAHELPELLNHSGYVGGGGIEAPKRLS